MTDEQLEMLINSINKISNELIKLNGYLANKDLKNSIIGK